MGTLRNVVRKEETRAALDRLRHDHADWLEHRRDRDREAQYETQLAALEETLNAGRATVKSARGGVSTTYPQAVVYARCREIDQEVVFLRRYLEHFSAKWDQRDGDEQTAATLLAAEEIVWSCWATVFRALGAPVSPAPLPYLETEFDPRARPRSDPPRSLRADARLAQAVGALPVPLIGLPPVCRDRPWWLVHIAHETGHHIQYDAAGGAFFDAFAGLVEDAAEQAGADGSRWCGWQQELFADACAALSTGSAAVWALDEQLTGEAAAVAASKSGYPALAVREAMMVELLAALGLAPDAGVPPYAAPAPAEIEGLSADPGLMRRLETDLAAVHAVAGAVAERPLDGAGALPALLAFGPQRFTEQGDAGRWRRRLLAAPRPPAETTLPAARLAVAGAVAAWRQVAPRVAVTASRAAHFRWSLRSWMRCPAFRLPPQEASRMVADWRQP